MSNFASYEEEALFYAESALEDRMLHNEVQSMFDMYNIAFLEAGDAGVDATKTKGIGTRIIDAISRILEKIGNVVGGIIEGFKTAFTSDKKKLTADEYMNADSTQEKLYADFNAIADQVDEEYRLARPLIASITNITKMDSAKVEEMCDKLDAVVSQKYDETKEKGRILYKNKEKIATDIGVKVLSNKLIDNSKAINKYKDETSKYMIRMKSRKLNDVDIKNMNKIDRIAVSINRMVSKWDRESRKVRKYL